MKKDKFPEGGVINDSAENATVGEAPEAIIPLDKLPEILKANPITDIIINIRDLPQADRLVLYSRLDEIMNYDRDKASQGVDASCHLFDEAIKSLQCSNS